MNYEYRDEYPPAKYFCDGCGKFVKRQVVSCEDSPHPPLVNNDCGECGTMLKRVEFSAWEKK
jgi:hypothetical protein